MSGLLDLMSGNYGEDDPRRAAAIALFAGLLGGKGNPGGIVSDSITGAQKSFLLNREAQQRSQENQSQLARARRLALDEEQQPERTRQAISMFPQPQVVAGPPEPGMPNPTRNPGEQDYMKWAMDVYGLDPKLSQFGINTAGRIAAREDTQSAQREAQAARIAAAVEAQAAKAVDELQKQREGKAADLERTRERNSFASILENGRQRERDARDAERIATAAEKVAAKKESETDKAVTKYADTLEKHGIPEFETALSEAEGKLAKYKVGQAPGLGRGVGFVPDWLQGNEAEDMRQAISAVKNTLLKARSGAAVTESELRRLVEELGTGGFRSEATLRKGLERIRERFDKVKEGSVAGVNDEVKSVYEQRGGIPIKRGEPPSDVPKGVDQSLWKHMTPAERALWKKN